MIAGIRFGDSVRVVDEVPTEGEVELSNIELIQGDCLEVMRGMESESIDLVFTSPPYNLGNVKKVGIGKAIKAIQYPMIYIMTTWINKNILNGNKKIIKRII